MKTIIQMAEEVGALGYVRDSGEKPHQWIFTPKELERFAALVRADEREACAKVCEDLETSGNAEFYGHVFAYAIRARGNT